MTAVKFVAEHPDAETLAAFVDGTLPRAEVGGVLAHLDRCPACTAHVRAANDDRTGRARAARQTWWWAAAAVALIGLVVVPFAMNVRRTPAERLVELAPRSLRAVEPRLTGGFVWAPYRGPVRASDDEAGAAQLKLKGLAGELLERADGERSAAAQRDAGVGLVLIGESGQAVARLREATTKAPQDARAWSDLAAAQYALAVQLGRSSAYAEALASADAALRIDPRLAEALFNRALILEALGLTGDARAAWQRYLQVDRSSPWSSEARTRLSRLRETTAESLFRRLLPLLEEAAARGDATRVDAFVAEHRLQARAWGEAEYLGQWGESGSPRSLAVARAVGDALARLGGERLLQDAVRAVDRTSRRASLAEAHGLYRRGRIAYGRQDVAVAERDLRRAAALFRHGASPMALVARYYAASARYDANDVAGAEGELRALLEEIPPKYAALGAQVRWQLALCRMQENDWSGALPLVHDAERTFRRLDERSNAGFLQTLLADTLMTLGRPDEAWAARIESFRVAAAEGRSHRLAVSLGGAARMELRAGRLDSARALLRLEQDAERTPGSEFLLTNALAREAMLAAALGDFDAAVVRAGEAADVASRVADAALRERALVDVELARGAALVRRDPRAAHAALSRAIDGYVRGGKPVMLPECHLLRARVRLSLHDRSGAKDDLDRGIALLERQRIAYAGAVVGTGIFDAGRALFRDAMTLAADANDPAAVFAYAERSLPQVRDREARRSAAETIGVHELQRRLRGTGAAVLQVISLDGEIVTVAVAEEELLLARRAVSREELATLAQRAVERDGGEARARLYDLVVRGVEPLVSRARHLIVVADPMLDGIPFGALYDERTGTHLVERATVGNALSAGSLEAAPPRRRPASLAAVSLPAGGEGAAALPRAAREVAELGSLYPRTVKTPPALAALGAAADVVHIAGHTRRRRGTGAPALLLEGGNAMSWEQIAAAPRAPGGTVVLAACETLRRAESLQTFTLSLGAGFVAAGAAGVVGTLGEIRDEDAYELFRIVHRELASGADAPSAVRAAQIEALAAGGTAPWQAIAVLTRHIPHDQEGSSDGYTHGLLRRHLHSFRPAGGDADASRRPRQRHRRRSRRGNRAALRGSARL